MLKIVTLTTHVRCMLTIYLCAGNGESEGSRLLVEEGGISLAMVRGTFIHGTSTVHQGDIFRNQSTAVSTDSGIPECKY